MRGLYIHVPFCVRKCAYCDFYSLPARLEHVNRYVDAVLREASAYAGLSFQTLYIGGGTPSRLGPANLRKLMDGLKHVFDLSGLAEATMEVNPESATDELLQTARNTGINRISIGIQSLSDRELASVGRVHTAAQAIEALDQVKKHGFTNVSADLIIGLPGQEWRSLHTSIGTLVGLGVEHLSLYCLSVEERTPLAASPPVDLPSDDLQAELFDRASLLLEKSRFIHYEISNFARKGHECLHNLNYWRGGEYLGLGPAAASHLDGRRFKDIPDLDAYLKDPVGASKEVEELGHKEKAAEEAMLRLRLLAEGLDLDELVQRFGRENTADLADRLREMAAEGSVTFDNSRYRLSPTRVLTSNPIFTKVLCG